MERIDKLTFNIMQYIAINKYVTYEELEFHFDLSQKTIRDHINVIKSVIQKYENVKLIVKKGEGITLEGDLSKILDKSNFEVFDFSDNESRIIFILARLLQTDDYIKIQDLSDEMFLSRTTVENVLKTIKTQRLSEGLKYKSNRKGIKIEGDELSKRKLLTSTISYYWGGIVAIDSNLNRSIDVNFSEGVNFLLEENFKKISNIVNRFIVEEDLVVNEYEYKSLLIHIAIAIERLIQGNKIEDNFDFKLNRSQKAIKLVRQIEDEFDLVFPQLEIDYISIHINSICNLPIYLKIDENSSNSMNEDLITILKSSLLIKNFNEENLSFFLLHLNAAINRLKNGLSISNPLKNEIKITYPLAYSFAVTIAKKLKHQYKITLNDDEISYIALHVQMQLEGVRNKKLTAILVCSSGYSTAKFLESRINKIFGDCLNVTRTLGLNEFLNYEVKEDLIISTIPIKQTSHKVITVTPLLDEFDQLKIKTNITNEIEGKSTFLELFKIQLLFINDKEDLKFTDVIRDITDVSTKLDYSYYGIYENTIDREQISFTVMDGFSMPHSNIDFIKEPFISIYINKNGIDWGTSKVDIAFYFGLNYTLRHKISKLYDFFNEFVSDRKNLSLLKKAKTYEEVVNIIKRS